MSNRGNPICSSVLQWRERESERERKKRKRMIKFKRRSWRKKSKGKKSEEKREISQSIDQKKKMHFKRGRERK